MGQKPSFFFTKFYIFYPSARSSEMIDFLGGWNFLDFYEWVQKSKYLAYNMLQSVTKWCNKKIAPFLGRRNFLTYNFEYWYSWFQELKQIHNKANCHAHLVYSYNLIKLLGKGQHENDNFFYLFFYFYYFDQKKSLLISYYFIIASSKCCNSQEIPGEKDPVKNKPK